MHFLTKTCCLIALAAFGSAAVAQPPAGGGGRPGRGQGNQSGQGNQGNQANRRGFDQGRGGAALIDRMLMMDANGDGQLTADEVSDARLTPMLNRADANQDGIVTQAELSAMMGAPTDGNREAGDRAGGPRRGGRPGEDMSGFGPPQPGQVMPSFMQDQLQLTDQQRAAVAKLQAEVDAQLTQILTADQLQQMQQRFGGGPRGQQDFQPGDRGRGRGQGRRPFEQ